MTPPIPTYKIAGHVATRDEWEIVYALLRRDTGSSDPNKYDITREEIDAVLPRDRNQNGYFDVEDFNGRLNRQYFRRAVPVLRHYGLDSVGNVPSRDEHVLESMIGRGIDLPTGSVIVDHGQDRHSVTVCGYDFNEDRFKIYEVVDSPDGVQLIPFASLTYSQYVGIRAFSESPPIPGDTPARAAYLGRILVWDTHSRQYVYRSGS